MAVIGFNFDTINAEKLNKLQGKVNIKYNIGIKNLSKDKVSLSSTDEVLKFDFEYKTEYEPKIGNIILRGHILYLEDKKRVKEIIEIWQKEKKIPSEIMQKIINTILERCTIKALVLETELNLPPHIKLPSIKHKSS